MKGITLRDYIDMYCHFCWEMSIAANALMTLFFKKKTNMEFEKKNQTKNGASSWLYLLVL